MKTPRRVSLLGLRTSLWRQDAWPSLILAALVFALTLLALVSPKLLNDLYERELNYGMHDSLNEVQSALSANAPGELGFFPASHPQSSKLSPELAEEFGSFDEWMAEQLSDVSELLRSMILGYDYHVFLDADVRVQKFVDPPTVTHSLRFAKDPALPDQVRLIEGRFPESPSTIPVDPRWGAQPEFTGIHVREIVLHSTVAEQLGWEVGENRMFRQHNEQFTLVGVFSPLDETDPRWSFIDFVDEVTIFDDGDNPPNWFGTAFIHPEDYFPQLGSPQSRAWFLLDTAVITQENSSAVLAELRGFTSKSYDADPAYPQFNHRPVSLYFRTQTVDTLETVLHNIEASSVIVTVLVLGPIVAGILVIFLVSRMIVLRRESHLALLQARGTSVLQLRRSHFIEGFVTALPAAALALPVSALITDSPIWPTPAQLSIIAAFILVTGILLASAVGRVSLRGTRADTVASQRSSTTRYLSEFGILMLAAVSMFLFFNQGLGTVQGTGFDPVVSLTPIFAILAITVVVVRLFPVLLKLLQAGAKRGKALVAFLVLSRALREQGAKLSSIVATVLSLTVALLSVLMLNTVTDGGAKKAWLDVGGDLQVRGVIITEEVLEELAALPSVAAVAPLSIGNRAVADQGSTQRSITVFYTDLTTLAKVHENVPWAVDYQSLNLDQPPGSLAAIFDQRITVEPGRPLKVNQMTVTERLTGDHLPGEFAAVDWVLLDVSEAAELRHSTTSRTALVSLKPGSSSEDAQEEIIGALGERAIITSHFEQLDQIKERPVVLGMQIILLSTATLSLLLSIISLALIAFGTKHSRERVIPLLGGLGLQRAGRAWLVFWEIMAVALLAIAVAAASAWIVAWLLLTKISLAGFAGGITPALALDPFWFGGTSLLFFAAGLLIVAVTLRNTERLRLNLILRKGEE